MQNTVTYIGSNSCFSHTTPTLKSLHWLPIFYSINFKMYCVTRRAIFLSEPFYLSTLLTHRSITHSLHSTSSAFFYNLISIKNLISFVLFLMLHHFSEIIYLILFALCLLTCHLEEISKLIYLTKLFVFRLSSL